MRDGIDILQIISLQETHNHVGFAYADLPSYIMNSLWWSGVKIDHRHRHGATKADPRRGGGRHRGGVRGGGRTPGPPDHFVWSTGTYTCTLYLLLHLYVPVWNRRAATGFYGFIILFYSDKGYVINCFPVIIFASTMFSTSNCRNSLFAN